LALCGTEFVIRAYRNFRCELAEYLTTLCHDYHLP
jgi:hypothetical protein